MRLAVFSLPFSCFIRQKQTPQKIGLGLKKCQKTDLKTLAIFIGFQSQCFVLQQNMLIETVQHLSHWVDGEVQQDPDVDTKGAGLRNLAVLLLSKLGNREGRVSQLNGVLQRI